MSTFVFTLGPTLNMKPHRVLSKVLRTLRPHSCRHVRSSSSYISNLKDRGLFQNIFPDTRYAELLTLLEKPQAMYCGFDPTSGSLQIGNLISIVALLHGQRAGHLPIAVVGGTTATIGDPSGKTKERDLLPADVVEKNTISIVENIQNIFENHQNYFWKGENSLPPYRILNNLDWFSNQNISSFTSSIARHLRLGDMISRHTTQTRLNSKEGMSCSEFMYQMFQAADWLHLFQNYNCTIQIGGNDQLGNITTGFELIHKLTGKYSFGLVVPLLLSPSGEKLGKSSGNSVWCRADYTSPYEFYQYLLNLPDSSVEMFLNLFTFCSDEEIKSITALHHAQPEKRLGQQKIAHDVTLLVHGDVGLSSALRCTEVLFGKSISAMQSLDPTELNQLFKDTPTVEMKFDSSMTVMDLAIKVGCFKREVDAQRIIEAGGFYINQERVTDPHHLLSDASVQLANDTTLLRTGKKTYYVVKWLT